MTPETSAAATARPPASCVMRQGEDGGWDGIAITEYKAAAEHHCGVTRQTLIGQRGETTTFHVRYFEIAPGGYSSLEHHAHEHFVIVLRGHGEVQFGDSIHDLASGDAAYVAPHEVHQFRNLSGTEP